MKIAVLTCVLGGFDTLHNPVTQDTNHDVSFHRYTDEDFPPITGLTPRLQYRIPKCFGWDMYPDHDVYIWLDGAVTLEGCDCVEWYLSQLGDNDMGFFKHPYRDTVSEEVEHIEAHLRDGRPYITNRYKNGGHRVFLNTILKHGYTDDTLFASTMFIYRNTKKVQDALTDWWATGSRHFSCDQVQLSYILKKHNIKVRVFDEHIYKSRHITIVSKHK